MTALAGGPPLVVLVGPPGAGKTTVATALARRLGTRLRDTDEDIERLAGRTVAEIFVESGEDHFRALERRAVAVALAEHPGVLALGGGAVMAPATQEALRGHRVVFLDVGVAKATRRVGLDAPRPLLVGSPRARWIELMARRRPVYEAVSVLRVDTDERTVAQVAQAVVDGLGLTGGSDLADGSGPLDGSGPVDSNASEQGTT
ncbi:MAG: shikimate kinase [Actinomycetota bacterium]|nr:shikimate kinase [Actinomycetota bacterium]